MGQINTCRGERERYEMRGEKTTNDVATKCEIDEREREREREREFTLEVSE